MEALQTVVAIIIIGGLIYLKFRALIAGIREFRQDREFRVVAYAFIVLLPIVVGGCTALEALTGISPDGTPPSFAIRLTALAGFFALWFGLSWWNIGYPDFRRRRRFLRGKLCPACNRALQSRRLQHPILSGSDEPSETHWLHLCACGVWTMYDEHGLAREVVDRTRDSPDA